jgi:hypothetical protein
MRVSISRGNIGQDRTIAILGGDEVATHRDKACNLLFA